MPKHPLFEPDRDPRGRLCEVGEVIRKARLSALKITDKIDDKGNKSDDGKTLLKWAILTGASEVKEVLKNCTADEIIDAVLAKDCEGNTELGILLTNEKSQNKVEVILRRDIRASLKQRDEIYFWILTKLARLPGKKSESLFFKMIREYGNNSELLTRKENNTGATLFMLYSGSTKPISVWSKNFNANVGIIQQQLLIKDAQNHTALYYAVENSCFDNFMTLLKLASDSEELILNYSAQKTLYQHMADKSVVKKKEHAFKYKELSCYADGFFVALAMLQSMLSDSTKEFLWGLQHPDERNILRYLLSDNIAIDKNLCSLINTISCIDDLRNSRSSCGQTIAHFIMIRFLSFDQSKASENHYSRKYLDFFTLLNIIPNKVLSEVDDTETSLLHLLADADNVHAKNDQFAVMVNYLLTSNEDIIIELLREQNSSLKTPLQIALEKNNTFFCGLILFFLFNYEKKHQSAIEIDIFMRLLNQKHPSFMRNEKEILENLILAVLLMEQTYSLLGMKTGLFSRITVDNTKDLFSWLLKKLNDAEIRPYCSAKRYAFIRTFLVNTHDRFWRGRNLIKEIDDQLKKIQSSHFVKSAISYTNQSASPYRMEKLQKRPRSPNATPADPAPATKRQTRVPETLPETGSGRDDDQRSTPGPAIFKR